MSDKKYVYLNEVGQWLLFRAMVCEELEKQNMQRLIDCDPWTYSESLDMSFEETRALPLELWGSKIAADCEELKRDLK
nr:MAG TPA: hypothetical protein [Caudoviricetes sp.]